MVMGGQLVDFLCLPATTERELLILLRAEASSRPLTCDAFSGRNQWQIGREEDL
jgi:hypothetical protein